MDLFSTHKIHLFKVKKIHQVLWKCQCKFINFIRINKSKEKPGSLLSLFSKATLVY